VNWLMTGVGRAYLAFCPPQERETTIRLLRKSDQFEDQLARDPKRLERVLAETRARGYGTRDPAFIGGLYRAPTDDGLSGIAVPLLDRTRVHGSINILWIRSAMTIEECAARYLADLKDAAVEIVGSLNARGRRR
jgi:IclR family mhp operon transcriptional activator